MIVVICLVLEINLIKNHT